MQSTDPFGRYLSAEGKLCLTVLLRSTGLGPPFNDATKSSVTVEPIMRGRRPTGHPSIPEPKDAFPSVNAAKAPLTSLMLGLGMLDDGALGPLTDAQRDVVRAMVADVARVSKLVDQELRIERLLPEAALNRATALELASRVSSRPRPSRAARPSSYKLRMARSS